MPQFNQREFTFGFPNLNGRFEGHVVNWDENIAESVHLARDGEDFFGVITRAYDHYCAVSTGPIIFVKNGEGRHLTAGEHLVGAVVNGVGGYVREARSLEHTRFGLTNDVSEHTFTSRRGASSEAWPIQTRSYVAFTGDGDPHIASRHATHGVVVAETGVYSFDLQISLLIESITRNILTTILQVDNDEGHVESLAISSNPLPSTAGVAWDVVQVGFTPPLDFTAGDRVSLDFSWHPVSGATNTSFDGTMQIVDTLGVNNFLEVDRFNFLDGTHGTVIHDAGVSYTPGEDTAPMVEIYVW